jgi:NADH-quinone oxidoreductase subunit L
VNTALWIAVLAPFVGALVLIVFGARMPKKMAGATGCASVGISLVAAMAAGVGLLRVMPAEGVRTSLYTWMSIGGLSPSIGLHLDALSLVMMLVITFVGFLIHLYASQSMYEEDGYSRFFAYMNLFVGSMLTLVLADNLLLLYLGWEGVGLCSYLLIGFWYKDSANGAAAQKAFIVTRVGDTALAIALFWLFTRFGTLDIQTILSAVPGTLMMGGAVVTWIAVLVIGGAVGKSAQVPLQTWLPDAMAGPTPVSALIHAATMVTAGVYLIARMNVLFTLAPAALFAVAVIGTVTLFYSGFSALVQRDIKRVLAYSTISQIGYMFLALGVGAWSAAMFHFLTHAFFKALLFLAAGVVIDAQHHEHDILRMGGLKRRLPFAYWTFLIGSASLSALPLVTAGFYSKDAIIWAAYSSPIGNAWLWLGALAGALITAVYSFRVVCLVFHGEQKIEVSKYPGGLMKLSLAVLAFFSITAGFIGCPEVIAHFDPFGEFMQSVFHASTASGVHANLAAESVLLGVSSLETLLGIYLAVVYFRHGRYAWIVERSPALQAVHRFFFVGWRFDWLYDRLFVRPYKALATWSRGDAVDAPFAGLARLATYGSTFFAAFQTGRLRNYTAGIVLGAVVLMALVLLR